MEIKEICRSLAYEMSKKGVYPSVLYQYSKGTFVFTDKNERRIQDIPTLKGIVLSVFNGKETDEYATYDIDYNKILKEAKRLKERIKGGNFSLPIENIESDFKTECEIEPEKISIKEKLELVENFKEKMIKRDKRIVNVQSAYIESEDYKVFSDGNKTLSQSIIRTRVFLMVQVMEGNIVRWNYLIKGIEGGYEVTRISDEELEKLCSVALELLGAKKIEPGFYDCIVDPSVSGVIAHEAFGHGVEMDMFVKGRAKAKEYLLKRVGSDVVNIYDDPTIKGAFGSYFFDDQGTIAKRTHIVQNGIFKNGLTDLLSYTRLKTERSANGRRESFKRKVYARMSNTFFGKGDKKIEDMITNLENGVFIERVEGGMEDPKGWGMQVNALIARDVKGGKFTGKIFSPIIITGYVPDILMSITECSDSFELDSGGCGKGHKEIVPVSTGGPHLRLKARLE
uniref:TldD/PmbA family protein n=1 Tax=candidate division WOR-3 bacterium TaxID=2052148 RepID=A0A7C4UD93_UNCW3